MDIETHLQLVVSPNYPQMPFFQLIDPPLLSVVYDLAIFRHVSFVVPVPPTSHVRFREQVTAVIEQSWVDLAQPIMAGIQWRNLRYPDLTTVTTENLSCLYVPDSTNALAEIVVQFGIQAASPDSLYSAVASMASQMAYETDSPVRISEWRWFSVRDDGVHVRRDFRASSNDRIRKTWQDLQKRTKGLVHLRGDTLWTRAMAHYHESIVLSLPMYQFLALYKGCEVLRELEARLGRRGYTFEKATMEWPLEVRSCVPDGNASVHRVLDHELRKPYRNAVAHWEVENRDGSPGFAHSDLFDVGCVSYAQLVEVAKVCFRCLAETLMNAKPPS